jgi:hypothetical protein
MNEDLEKIWNKQQLPNWGTILAYALWGRGMPQET